MILTNRRERTRFFRFLVVGGIGFIVDFTTFNLLRSLLDFPPVLASVFSFISAVSSNFVWHRYWTYPDSRSKRIPRQLLEFAMVSLTGLLIRTPLIAVLIRPMRALFTQVPAAGGLPAERLGDNLALAIAVIVVMFWNFFVNRYWTYADVD